MVLSVYYTSVKLRGKERKLVYTYPAPSSQLPRTQWNNSEVYVLQWLHDFSGSFKLQVPTVVPDNTSFIHFLYFPVSLHHSATYVFWDNLPKNYLVCCPRACFWGTLIKILPLSVFFSYVLSSYI